MKYSSKAFVLITVVIISVIFFSSCEGSFQGGNYVLNDRQKAICEELGLPTDYEEMDSSQQDSIKRIEEMLQYLDNKYGCTFVYAGYVDGGLWAQMENEEEKLYAYAEGQDPDELTEVTVNENDEFEDTYMWHLVRDNYEKAAEDYLKEATGNERIKVFAFDGATTISEIDKINQENLKGNCTASCDIFIYGTFTNEEMIAYANIYADYLKANEFWGHNELSFERNSDTFEQINDETYKDIFSNSETLESIYCIVKENKVTVQ